MTLAIALASGLTLAGCDEEDDDGNMGACSSDQQCPNGTVCQAGVCVQGGDGDGDGDGDELEGSWESDINDCVGIGEYHERNVIEIDSDLEGEATVFFAVWVEEAGDYDCSFVEFDVDAQSEGDGDFTLEFDCVETNSLVFGCPSLDFEAECQVDGDDLECDGEGVWADYEFAYERD